MTSTNPDSGLSIYSLYLVTGRDLLPPGVDYYETLDRCLRDGCVKVVQIREKDADTAEFLDIARRSLAICDKYDVPMLINDNLAVCLALPERVGLHVGQQDLPIHETRRLLGPKRLLGISVNNVEQARLARESKAANYAGVGPCYGTQSKAGITDDKIIGIQGAQAIVAELAASANTPRLPCVLIGGLNQLTSARALFGATSARNSPDGVAVISAIMARPDSDVAAQELSDAIRPFTEAREAAASSSGFPGIKHAFTPQTAIALLDGPNLNPESFVDAASNLLAFHRRAERGPPLIQTITSHVSSTMSANLALAFSSSPIMSHEAEEAADLSRAIGALVLNIGTISESSRKGMRVAGMSANKNRKPVVLDPVGGGATQFRKKVVREILNHTQITLLKGNAAELASIAGNTEVQSRGVDSGSGSLTDPISLVTSLAQKERCLVLLSGKTDYLTDGSTVIASTNGHPLLGAITGSGCALGVTIAAGLAASCSFGSSDDSKQSTSGSLGKVVVAHGHAELLLGALMGLLSMTIASEKAAARADVRGPGTFIAALQDELASISPDDLRQYARLVVTTGH